MQIIKNDIVMRTKGDYNAKFYLVLDVKISDDKALIRELGHRRNDNLIVFKHTKETILVQASTLMKLF